MKHAFQKLIRTIKERPASPFLVGIGATLVVWALGAVFLYFVTAPTTPKPSPQDVPVVTEPVLTITLRRALDGMPVEEGAVEPPVYALMIDNLIDARMQSGLAKAHLVFEIPVESGITRFMALYLGGDSIAKVGPVRSARPYFIDYAAEFGAMYLHVGGSPDALTKLSKTDAVTNVDQFSNGKSFYRATDRYAPHNVYTTSILVEQLLTAKGMTTATYQPWIFRDETKPEELAGTAGVKIVFSTPAYEAEWRYDKTKNDYVRYQARAKYHDQDGTEVHAKNVAVVVTTSKVLDNAGRRELTTLGEGDAYVLSEGKVIQGKWKKASATDRLRFYNSEGNEIGMLAGTTWIEVVTDPAMVKLTE